MSDDSFREVTTQSWGSRIGQSWKGIIPGVLLFIGAFPLLFWNEGRAVKTAKSLDEGAAAVESIHAGQVSPENEGKLVHVTGLATTDEVLKDPEFGIALPAIKLLRTVEMYQWKEEKHSKTETKLGGGTETVTEYHYKKVWSTDVIPSSKFKRSIGHANPSSKPYQDRKQVAQRVTLEAFTLNQGLVGKINAFTPIPVDEQEPTHLPERPSHQSFKVHNGKFYTGQDPLHPHIGDVRIGFQAVRPTTVSIIAQQVGKSFTPYATRAGRSIELLYTGHRTAEEMFASEVSKNTLLTWVLRFAGLLVMTIGLSMVFRPLSVLADVIPPLGALLRGGIGIVAFIVALALSLLTIAIGWMTYRPLLGGTLILATIGLFVGLKFLSKKTASTPTSSEVPASSPPPPPPSP